MELNTSSARACLALTLPFKVWSVDTVTNRSSFPGLSGFLRYKTFSAKPGKSGANLDKFMILSADHQPWGQLGSLLEMQSFRRHYRPTESESAFSKNSRSFRGTLKIEGSAFPKIRRAHASPEMCAFKGLIFC